MSELNPFNTYTWFWCVSMLCGGRVLSLKVLCKNRHRFGMAAVSPPVSLSLLPQRKTMQCPPRLSDHLLLLLHRPSSAASGALHPRSSPGLFHWPTSKAHRLPPETERYGKTSLVGYTPKRFVPRDKFCSSWCAALHALHSLTVTLTPPFPP